MAKFILEGEQTDRIRFRRIRPSDFEAWLPFYYDPTSTQYWEGVPKDPHVACQGQIDRAFERYEKDLGGMNALIEKSDGALIGICGLLVQVVDEQEELEIGYSLLPKYRKQGYAIEAAAKCKLFAFEHQLSESLISIIHVDNLPSQKVALKNGMFLDKTTVYKDNPVHIYRVLIASP